MNIAIIWWWAAGLMAVATLLEEMEIAKEKQAYHGVINILLFDKNPGLWAKVIISWGGRCNLTTSITSIKELKTKYIRGADFLDDSLKSFTPRSIYKRFEQHDIPLKIEDDGRVFPVSNNGKDVVKIFEELCYHHKVDLHLREWVESISQKSCSDGRCDGFLISTTKAIYSADILVITTWWTAFSHTWSSGDGYSFARGLWHSITPLGPSLNSFLTSETRPHRLSGTVFEDGWFRILKSDTQQQNTLVKWPILCTHFGISGPGTFALSAEISYETVSKDEAFKLYLIPDARKNFERWNELLVWREKWRGPLVVNKLATIFTRKTAECFVDLISLDPSTHLQDFSSADRKKLCHLLSDGIELHLIQRRPGDEFVTAGWVNTDEVNPKTMESKIVPWLYFAGEVLNIDGLTGGFNLTSSRATGRKAGLAIIKKLTTLWSRN